MKNKNRLLATGAFIALALSFTACKKGLDNNTSTPLSAVMAFNLAPDKEAVSIGLSGSNLTNTPLGYTSFTGSYRTIYPGSREVTAYDLNASAPFATTTQDFEVNKYYSAFVLGANGTYRNVVVRDNFDSLTAASGKSFVRYINAIPDSSKPAISISANGTVLSNRTDSFGTVSAFLPVEPGDILLKANNGGNINVNRTVTLEKSKVYTLLLIGLPGSTDTTKAVQVKYITNGTAD